MRFRAFLFAIVVVLLQSFPVVAHQVYFATDIPVELGAIDFQTHDVIGSANGTYSLFASLSPDLEIGALHLESNGILLFSPTVTVTLGTLEFEPRDVVGFDGANYFPMMLGINAGIPPEARIDAILVEPGSGRLVISLDIPVESSGTTFYPSDLETVTGNLSPFWSGADAGVPPEANLTGAEYDPDKNLVVSFDIPVTLGTNQYKQGDLIQWTGTSFIPYPTGVSFPAEAHINDFAFATPSGAVPNVLKVTKAGGGNVALNWTTSCAGSDTDYEIYAGDIGSFTSHQPQACSTGGATNLGLQPPPGSVYFLVVPRNGTAEGSYGRASDGSERPQSSNACITQQISCSP